MKRLLKNQHLLLIFIIFLGFFFRFYNLNWGEPYFFHPDERNIAKVLSRTWDPGSIDIFFEGTFSYGNFPILYLHPIKALILKLNTQIDPFTLSVYLLRLNSLIFSMLTMVLIFAIGSKFNRYISYLGLSLSALSVGLIQNSHFGTFDTFISFWILLASYYCIELLTKKKAIYYYLSLLSISIASTAKITSLSFTIVAFASLLMLALEKKKSISISKSAFSLVASIAILALPFVLSPYYLSEEFIKMLFYEKEVVSGSIDVFYTQSFNGTIPVFFQFTDIYPFLLNPVITLIFIFMLARVFFAWLKFKKNSYLLLVIAFIVLFIPQSFLFSKWSRYMIPTLPFVYLITPLGISTILDGIKNSQDKLKAKSFIFFLLIVIGLAYSVLYTKIALQKSTAITASAWASRNISSKSRLLVEPYDIGISTFNKYFEDLEIFNFYDLEYQNGSYEKLEKLVKDKDYFVISSQRILKSRILQKDLFPKGHEFYSQVLNNNRKYEKVFETECNLYCHVLYLGDPISSIEETSIVFDRPTFIIYKILK